MLRSLPAWITPAMLTAAFLLFIVLGLALIPLPGIQEDEALFTAPLFGVPSFSVHLLGHHLPLMVFSYTGALKTYLFWPIFKIFPPGPYSLRVPVLLAGALTILGLYYFTKRISGPKAALFAALLLASDPTFLMSDTFDWGPVALQHLLLIGGLCLIVRGNVVAASLVFGLALWEKSVFLWAIAGLIAGALVYRAEIGAWLFPGNTLVRGSVLHKRRLALAAAAFVAGASPLIVYNIKSGNQTVRTTAHFSLDRLPQKFRELGRAIDGGGMFRFLVAEAWETNAKPVDTVSAGISDAIHDLAGDSRSDLMPYALSLAILAAPLWWRTPFRKSALFAIAFCVAAFAAMAVTRDAGEAIHHTVLLWPMPQLLVGVALAAIPPRWLSGGFAALLIVSNLLVIDQYIYQLTLFGADSGFTDAIYPLSERLPLAADDKIYAMDWGLVQTLTFLHRGQLPLVSASDPFLTPAPDATAAQFVQKMLADPRGLFIDHVKEREVFAGVGERLDAAARAAGYRKQMVETVTDSTGRPVFELFRFRK